MTSWWNWNNKLQIAPRPTLSFPHLHPTQRISEFEGHTWRGAALRLAALTALVPDTRRRINGLVFMRRVDFGAVDVPVHAKSRITERHNRQQPSGWTGVCRPISRLDTVTNGERCQESALASPTQSYWVNIGRRAVIYTTQIRQDPSPRASTQMSAWQADRWCWRR